MRSTKHRSKKSACGLCKPHKQGWAPKGKGRDRAREVVARREMKTAT